jgi:ADP-ribosyl-[dinitrogen reductase] hydrolase
MLGTAVGDALGLPWEGLPSQRIPQDLPRTPLSGLVSDDTEHTVLVAESWLEGGDLDGFRRVFASGLRRWMLGIPVGIGSGTLRACLKLLVGFSPERSGVGSAGNGAAMRAALLGLLVPEESLDAWIEAASHVTHRDERAVDGARVVAVAARIGARAGLAGKRAHTAELLQAARTEEMRAALQTALEHAVRGAEPAQLARALGVEGFVTGYVVHTVPVAVFLWLRHDDPAESLSAAVHLGGDTDTVAAIAGALQGATVGASGLPTAWVDGLRDTLVSRERLQALAAALSRGEGAPPRVRWHQWLARSARLVPLTLGWLVARRLWAR